MTKPLTPGQVEIMRLMREAAAGRACIIYRSEYLGWLPVRPVPRGGGGAPGSGTPPAAEAAERVGDGGHPGHLEQAGPLRRVREKHEMELDEDEIIHELVEGE
ncbi:MAG TPA: hypothetical protein VF006_19830 [Longimicrobium sp.]